MDPFEGYEKLPHSLHRYQYVAANPANMVDPSGWVSPADLVFGNRVHEEIYKHFVQQMRTTRLGEPFANRAVSTLVGTYVSNEANFWTRLAYGASFLARPDLAYRPRPGDGGEEPFIFEIKPEGLEDEASAEVRTYLFLLNSLDERRIWREGEMRDYKPPPEIDIDGHVVSVWNGPPGVILYATSNDERLRRASLAIASVGAIGAMALVSVTATVATSTGGLF
jgi:hypothetical protein